MPCICMSTPASTWANGIVNCLDWQADDDVLIYEHCLSTAGGLSASMPDSLFCAAHPSPSFMMNGIAQLRNGIGHAPHVSLLNSCKESVGTLA